MAQQGVDPPELRKVVGMLAAGDDSLVAAVGCGHGAEAGDFIGENMAHGREQGRLKVCHELAGAAMLVPVLSGLLPSVGRPRCHC